MRILGAGCSVSKKIDAYVIVIAEACIAHAVGSAGRAESGDLASAHPVAR